MSGLLSIVLHKDVKTKKLLNKAGYKSEKKKVTSKVNIGSQTYQ